MRNSLLIIVLGIIAGLGILFWDSPAELFFLEDPPRVETLPTADSYMRNTRSRKFAANGQLSYTLTARTGLYYAREDRFELESPEVVARQADAGDEPWRLQAASAEIRQGGEEVLLSGDVHAWQDVSGGRNEMFSDDIRFSPKDNTASTDARVKLVHPEGTTTGTGMRADFDRETYQLLADVRGVYVVR